MELVGLPHEKTYPRISAQLATIAPQSLFFGAFACNSINFLFRPEAMLAPVYCVAAAGCFTMSLMIVQVNSSIEVRMAMLDHSEAKKEFFARGLSLNLRSMWQQF